MIKNIETDIEGNRLRMLGDGARLRSEFYGSDSFIIRRMCGIVQSISHIIFHNIHILKIKKYLPLIAQHHDSYN